MNRKTLDRFLTGILFLIFVASLASAGELPSILGVKDQAAVVDGWLVHRLEKVLPEVMRREKIDMWLVICQEYNEDPVYLSLVPFDTLSARRLSILVFYDGGEASGVERFSASRYSIGDFYKSVWKAGQEDQWLALAGAIKERNPKRIGIDESETFAFGDGLSISLKKRLIAALGDEYARRLVSAEGLAVGWLERRLPEELEVYAHIVSIAHGIIAEALSNGTITPGVTTTEDVEWWMWERVRRLGLQTWFRPSVSIQRPKSGPLKGSQVIHRGDLLHCDFGITYLRLNTDTQQMAYVLKEGETEAPKGLREAMAQGNRLQDIHMSEMKEGLTGNEILAATLKRAKEEGLKPSVYSHPLGFHGHAAGPTIGLWDMQGGVPGTGDYPLHYDTAYSIELNVRAIIPEWENQEVRIALEQDAAFTRSGAYFLDRRQTVLHLIK